MYTSPDKLHLFILGNYIEKGEYRPEFVNIAIGQTLLASQEIKFNDVQKISHIYGMIATVINDEEIYLCGGGEWRTSCTFDRFISTSNCQGFNLKDYTLTTLEIAMTEERTFAQSVMFENNTWLILGGQNSQNITTNTIEYLNTDNITYFLQHSRMPEHSAYHCAKMINKSHLFTTGGIKNLNLNFTSSLSRGMLDIPTNPVAPKRRTFSVGRLCSWPSSFFGSLRSTGNRSKRPTIFKAPIRRQIFDGYQGRSQKELKILPTNIKCC